VPFSPDTITDCLSYSLLPLSSYSLGQLNGGHPTGLGDENLASSYRIFLQGIIENELRDLRRLSTSCFPFNAHHTMAINQFKDFVSVLKYWKSVVAAILSEG